jgi:iron complex transport system ATP-binding protein
MSSALQALEAIAVTVTVDGRHLIEAVSCQVPVGKIIAVVGPNGAGKTTLLRVLSGELAPSSGEVRLNEKNLHAYTPEVLALRRAVLPQSSALAFPFTVEEVVLMGRAPHIAGRETAADRRMVHEAMERIEVAHLAQRNYLTLSGGEKQRVHLARVLAQLEGMQSPKYLLLDEPAAALDLAHQWQLMRVLREQANAGVGIFIILHDLQLAARHADEVIILKQGKAFTAGAPREVITEGLLRDVFAVNARIISHQEGQEHGISIFPIEA